MNKWGVSPGSDNNTISSANHTGQLEPYSSSGLASQGWLSSVYSRAFFKCRDAPLLEEESNKVLSVG
jgi:hypothetical protein